MEWITANWAEIGVVIGGFIFVFDRIAKLTPTETDNKIVALLYKAASVLSIKVPDNPGK